MRKCIVLNRLSQRRKFSATWMAAASIFAGSVCVLPASAQETEGLEISVVLTPSQPPPRKTSSNRAAGVPSSAKYYHSIWGIDNLLVRETASGNLIRFSYRVTDPVRAKVLNDRKATPYLFGQRSRALLQVPVMNKVGPLRQSMAPEAGREYWMTFSNKGNHVKAGDRVNVIIGAFHVDGLVVE